MRDRSNEPRTIIIAGVAMIVFGIVLVVVVWWLIAGIQAGVQSYDEIQQTRMKRDVAIYSTMLGALAVVLALLSMGLIGVGAVNGWKGFHRVRQR